MEEEVVVAAITVFVAVSLSVGQVTAIVALFIYATEASQRERVPDPSFRPGCPSGIFLGSITLPLVLTSRFYASGDQSKALFWSAVLCSLRHLDFYKDLAATRLERWSLFDFLKGATVSFGLGLILARLTGYVIFVWISIWIIQFFGSTIVSREILIRFPQCATQGETILVTSGILVYGGNILLTLFDLRTIDPIDCMLQIGIIGLSLMPPTYKFFLRILNNHKATAFSGAFLVIILAGAPAWFRFVAGIDQHPVLWVIDFMLAKPFLRFGLCVYWLATLCLLPYFYGIARSGIPQILVRKCYHILAVVMFVPAYFVEKEFLHLAFTVAFVCFGLVEMLRIWQIPPVARRITKFMSIFADHRDSDKLIISHFSLLLGCALPVWLHHGLIMNRILPPLAGILSIGIGDTMASYIGYNYGSRRISSTSKKTVEGTGAGIVSLLLCCALVQSFGSTPCQDYKMAVVFAGLLEAYTSQLDNIFVPLTFYATLLSQCN